MTEEKKINPALIISTAKEHEGSRFWRDVMKPFIEKQIDGARAALVTCDLDKIGELRGAVKAMTELLNFHQAMIDLATYEIETEKKQQEEIEQLTKANRRQAGAR